jgi:aminodeoxyfutalosine synthase
MLYGHIEGPEERIGHLLKVRAEQDASLASRPAHFNACVPLSFIPEGSAFGREGLPGPTAVTDLKTLAITRLVLDNVPHIKAFWVMQGRPLAQVALAYGCDDLDGTVEWYDITKREGAPDDPRRQALSVDGLSRLILEAGYTPVERDSLYRPVERYGPGPQDWRIPA